MRSVHRILYAHGFEGQAHGPKAVFLMQRLNAEVVAPACGVAVGP